MFKVGEVKHYYEKIGFALVELGGVLSVGEKIKFSFNDADLFDQIVELIQVGHAKLESANRGDMVLLKTNDKVFPGTKIFKA
jgi:hypothetical protein